MTDILLTQAQGVFDIVIDGDDLQADDGLETAVIISLFSDARALPDQIPPEFAYDLRGWWGDTLGDDAVGSLAWLLSREKMLLGVLRRLEQYYRDALQWLIDDGIAETVTVAVEKIDLFTAGAAIEITRGSAKNNYQFDVNWQAQVA